MKFTVFTPTFNRCNLIKKLYAYLDSEEYDDLEWLIVDDGSTDDTEQYVQAIINSSRLSIRYYKQKNSGKYIAFNKAIDEAKGEYFVCIDSDDLYIKGAFSKLEKLTSALLPEEGGICYLSMTPNGEIIGSKFPDNVTNCTLIDLYYRYGVTGDKGILHRTNSLKKYRFPVYPGEKFATETLLYGQIPAKYRLLNEAIEIKDYQHEGLTERYRELIRKNPHLSLENYRLIDHYSLCPKMAIKNTIRYVSFIYQTDDEWATNFIGCKHKILFVILSPIGYGIHLYYLLLNKNVK